MTTKNTALQVQTESSSISQFSQTDIDIIKNSVAKGTTDAELKYFLAVAASTGLNPFTKEIWCYKSGNDMLIFGGRDGFLSNAQKKSDFRGIRSSEVCENDEFDMNIVSGHIKHSFSAKNRGAIVGAYAIVKRDGMDAFIEWASIAEFDKNYNAWKTNKASMIKKVAEAHALKKAYSLNGVNSEHDYDFSRNTFSQDAQTEEAEYQLAEEVQDFDEAIKNAIEDAKSTGDLTLIYETNVNLHNNSAFLSAMSAKKQALKK